MDITNVKRKLRSLIKEDKYSFPDEMKKVFEFPDNLPIESKFSYTEFWYIIAANINYVIENDIIIGERISTEYNRTIGGYIKDLGTIELTNDLLLHNCKIDRIAPYNLNALVVNGLDPLKIVDFSAFDLTDLCAYLERTKVINPKFPYEKIDAITMNTALSLETILAHCKEMDIYNKIKELNINVLCYVFIENSDIFRIAFDENTHYLCDLFEDQDNQSLTSSLLRKYPKYICRFNYRKFSQSLIRDLVITNLDECVFFLNRQYVEECNLKHNIIDYFSKHPQHVLEFPHFVADYGILNESDCISYKLDLINKIGRSELSKKIKYETFKFILDNMDVKYLRPLIQTKGNIFEYIGSDLVFKYMTNPHNLWCNERKRTSYNVYSWEAELHRIYKKHTTFFERLFTIFLRDKQYKN